MWTGCLVGDVQLRGKNVEPRTIERVTIIAACLCWNAVNGEDLHAHVCHSFSHRSTHLLDLEEKRLDIFHGEVLIAFMVEKVDSDYLPWQSRYIMTKHK